MSRIRIVRIIARLNIGGPAVHLINLAAAMDTERFESYLIAGRPAAGEGDMGYLADELGVETIILPALSRELSPLRDLRIAWQLRKLLKDLRPDIVETHTAKAGAVGRVAAWLAGSPAVVHVFHGHIFHSYFGPWKTRLFRAIERGLARRASDRIVVISETQRRDIVEIFRIAPAEKVTVIPLGFPLQRFVEGRRDDRLRREFGGDAETILIGLVGRLTSIKNPRLLLDAARQLRDELPQLRFVLIGDGELRGELERYADAHRLRDVVHFGGWRREMPAVYKSLDLVVLTSNNEGTPVTLIEAMAAGTPVAATDVGGVADVVRHEETGLLIEAGSADGLATAIRRLVGERGLRETLARAGQVDVLKRFRLERLVADMESLYESICTRGDGR